MCVCVCCVCVCVLGVVDLERYCHDIIETAAWGGQPEVSCNRVLFRNM